jgi:hypothetical protein
MENIVTYNRGKMSVFTKYTKKEIKSLQGIYHLTWGFGLEHEMQMFHIPNSNQLPKERVQDFILFDSKSATKRLIEGYQKGLIELTNDEFDYLQHMTFETSGRVCNRQNIVRQAPYEMPEFISWKPFCSIQTRRNIDNLTGNILEAKEIFLQLLLKDPVTKKLIDKYGTIEQYPFGMTRYMSVPKKILSDRYLFVKKKGTGRPFVRNDYTGSYHVTFTLPHDEKTSEKLFIKQHQNFGNQLQWLEPLMLVGFFSGDEYAVGSKKNRVRGSYRVLNIGWGNLAGSDVRLFGTKGLGRYAKTPNYWRKGLDLYETEKLKPCFPASPSALKEKGTSSLSTDLRTFGSTDPAHPEARESGAPMKKPNGIEFRIFDQFNDIKLRYLTSHIALIAENSRRHQTKGYVYEDQDWIEALHQIMKDGYKAILSKSFIKKMRSKLGLNIKTTSHVAQDIWDCVYRELYEKNKEGEWIKIFFGIKEGRKQLDQMMEYKDPPHINQDSMFFAFFMKCNRDTNILHSFNQLSLLLQQTLKVSKKIEYKEMEEYVKKIMGREWLTVDMIYLYEFLFDDFIRIEKKKNGDIEFIVKGEGEMRMFNDFNEKIADMCFTGFLVENRD